MWYAEHAPGACDTGPSMENSNWMVLVTKREEVRMLSRRSFLKTLAVLGGVALLPPDRAARPESAPSIPIEVGGHTVLLQPGKNVHPETYAFLLANPGPDWFASVTWRYLDSMWVPLALGVPNATSLVIAPPLPSAPARSLSPDSVPECVWNYNVPACAQGGGDWGGKHMFDDPACAFMKDEGCCITSAWMAFAYFGYGKTPTFLNTCLGTNHCQNACGLLADCASHSCSDDRATFEGGTGFSCWGLCTLLSSGYLPIVQVRTPNNNWHWPLVHRCYGLNPSSPDDYLINDPKDGSTYKRLSYYSTSTDYRMFSYGRR